MFGQVLRGTIAVGSLLIGLQVVGTILAVAVETNDWFFLILGTAVALLVAAAVTYGIALVVTWTLAPLAAGWLGMAVGRHPYGYGAEDGNLQQAVGSAVLIVGLSLVGYALWRNGQAGADPFRVVTGLLVIVTAWFVGLAGLIPHLYFALRPGPAEPFEAAEGELPTILNQADHLVIGLAVCVFAGMGLAKCTAASVERPVDDRGRIVLSPGDWVFVCVGEDQAKADCTETARFTLRPDPERGRRIRLTLTRSCPQVRILDGEERPVAPLDGRLRAALGIPPVSKNKNALLVFDHAPGQRYTIEMGAGKKQSCHAGLRYAIEPTSGYGEQVP
jgi:hypothetical protein